MLAVEKLVLKAERKLIFNQLNIKFPLRGLSTIIGYGGSGKSALLNTLYAYYSEIETSLDGTITPAKLRCAYLMQNEKKSKIPITNCRSVTKDQLISFCTELWRFSPDATTFVLESFNRDVKLTAEHHLLFSLSLLLFSNPELLLLDEPLFGKSKKVRTWVAQMLNDQKINRMILLITHNIKFAKAVADYCVFLVDGEILETGSASELFNNPTNPTVKSIIAGGI